MINNKGNNYRKGWKLKVWKKPQRVPHIIQRAEKKGQAGKTLVWEVRSIFRAEEWRKKRASRSNFCVNCPDKKPKLNPHQRMPWCQFRWAGNWRLSKATVFPTTVAHEGVHFSWRKGQEEEHNLRETVKDGVLTIPDLWLQTAQTKIPCNSEMAGGGRRSVRKDQEMLCCVWRPGKLEN